MDKTRPAAVVMLLLVMAVPVGAAFANGEYTEDWEHGSFDGYTWFEGNDNMSTGGKTVEFTTDASEGEQAIHISSSETTTGYNSSLWTNETINSFNNDLTVETDLKANTAGSSTGSDFDRHVGIFIQNNQSQRILQLRIEAKGPGGDVSRVELLSPGANESIVLEDEIDVSVYNRYRAELVDNESLTLYINGTQVGSVAAENMTEIGNKNELRIFYFVNDQTTDMEVNGFYDNTIVTWDEINEALEIEASSYMKHGSTQSYKVTHTIEDETGSVEVIDVTGSANVTSSDPSVVQVSQEDKSLIATSNNSINQQVTIRAEYKDLVTEKEVTVANMSINNIGILPPATWSGAVIGTSLGDSTGASDVWPGAIQLQLIFLAISIGAFAGYHSGNPWAALGTAQLIMIGGWALDWASGGMIMASLFACAFFALTVADVAPALGGK